MSACYGRQTVNMRRIFNDDYRKVAQACSEIPETAQMSCYRSYGRDVGQHTYGDPDTAVAYCEYIPAGEYRQGCFSGAIGNRLSAKPGRDDYVISICRHLDHDPEHQDACYETTIQQAIYIQLDKQEFCPKLPESHQHLCYKT